MILRHKLPDLMITETKTSTFIPQEGGAAEFHVMVTVSDASLGYEKQLDAVLQAYAAASEGRTVHFRRFFLSDVSNQAPLLLDSLRALPEATTSIVHQPPLDGTRIALWMYCTSPMEKDGDCFVHEGYAHHWAGSIVHPGAGSYEQMAGIFADYDGTLSQRGLSVADNTIRTWIFARDVDITIPGSSWDGGSISTASA